MQKIINNRDMRFKIYLQHESTGNITVKEYDYNCIFSGAAKFAIETTLPNHFIIANEQYIGQLDADKNKIYTGDILHHIYDDSLFNWLVVFKNGCFGIRNIGVGGHLGEFFHINSIYYFNDRIIIGNIYNNPELLKKCL